MLKVITMKEVDWLDRSPDNQLYIANEIIVKKWYFLGVKVMTRRMEAKHEGDYMFKTDLPSNSMGFQRM